VEFEVSFPLDDDGFLRRECPHCRREFKLLAADDDPEPLDAATEGDKETGVFCPYCAQQSYRSELLTRGQRRVVDAAVLNQIVNPELGNLSEALSGLEAASSGLISGHLERSPETSATLTERNDMERVWFTCHGNDPVKVEDGWDRALHCSVCGAPR
jgi:uncharacterized Zn-finger protein